MYEKGGTWPNSFRQSPLIDTEPQERIKNIVAPIWNKESQPIEGSLCIIFEPGSGKIVGKAREDPSKKKNPIAHCVMEAIEQVAKG